MRRGRRQQGGVGRTAVVRWSGGSGAARPGPRYDEETRERKKLGEKREKLSERGKAARGKEGNTGWVGVAVVVGGGWRTGGRMVGRKQRSEREDLCENRGF